jgi:hypothetical protein
VNGRNILIVYIKSWGGGVTKSGCDWFFVRLWELLLLLLFFLFLFVEENVVLIHQGLQWIGNGME